MSRSFQVACAAAAVAAAYCIHGLVQGTGLVGWLQQSQVAALGHYSLKLTFLALMLGVSALFLGVWLVGELVGFGTSPRDQTRALARLAEPPQPLTWKGALWTAAAAIGLTWAIGLGIWWWDARTDTQDASATYERIVLGDSTQPPKAATSHVAMQGLLLGGHALAHHSGRHSSAMKPGHYLVPMVAPDWREGQPVAFVVKADHLESLRGVAAASRRAPMLLARVEGEVPVVAAQAFAKNGVPIADGARLLRWVPSRDGQPDIGEPNDETRRVMLMICGGITLMTILGIGGGTWAAQRRQRAGKLDLRA